MSFFSNLPVFAFFKNGQQTPVSKDETTPANSNPLPVELTSAAGDISINTATLALDVQTTGYGAYPDSMRITDGVVDLVLNPDGTLPVTESPKSFPPTVVNQTLAAANTEYIITVPTGTRSVDIFARNGGALKYAFVSGQSGTTYVTIPSGAKETLAGFKLGAASSIYIQSSKNSCVLEVVLWS